MRWPLFLIHAGGRHHMYLKPPGSQSGSKFRCESSRDDGKAPGPLFWVEPRSTVVHCESVRVTAHSLGRFKLLTGKPPKSHADTVVTPAMAGHGRPPMARHGPPWPAWLSMAGHGRPCPAMAGCVLRWPAMAGDGRPWPAMAGHGRLWPAMAGHGRRWPAMASHGQPWPAMTCHGPP